MIKKFSFAITILMFVGIKTANAYYPNMEYSTKICKETFIYDNIVEYKRGDKNPKFNGKVDPGEIVTVYETAIVETAVYLSFPRNRPPVASYIRTQEAVYGWIPSTALCE